MPVLLTTLVLFISHSYILLRKAVKSRQEMVVQTASLSISVSYILASVLITEQCQWEHWHNHSGLMHSTKVVYDLSPAVSKNAQKWKYTSGLAKGFICLTLTFPPVAWSRRKEFEILFQYLNVEILDLPPKPDVKQSWESSCWFTGGGGNSGAERPLYFVFPNVTKQYEIHSYISHIYPVSFK